ncbi:MAG TPA: shikimate dehydrogenase [Chitinophagales bacterium]|nr:shikimate dehydrogenase [Chitinophagales bacterium]HMU97269.1 shikimate dehydrogenase [Chitinophagales bacterium]HMV02850.1 shikimate dehydrogenase [Chitinophagales bacterium]HMW94684.1 shikimate dehydrogenase [Chitinophagales bacterium]HMY42716.1 shikimate dehydrogenase [Chitinophagales bacterium]
MRQFGLIGYPLSHSFSKGYFAEKFKNENITDAHYDTFPLENIHLIEQLFNEKPNLFGLNVTIPYKQQVIPFLDSLDEAAAKIGAVNTIKFIDGKKIGYNSDVYGFEMSLKPLLEKHHNFALILGTGGASKAVEYVLEQLNINFQYVSRTKSKQTITYQEIDEQLMNKSTVIINTSPIGMYPNIETAPEIPYQFISVQHLLYDLVYNPEVTLFLKKGIEKGAKTKNGLEMLHLQAERSWEIWNS